MRPAANGTRAASGTRPRHIHIVIWMGVVVRPVIGMVIRCNHSMLAHMRLTPHLLVSQLKAI